MQVQGVPIDIDFSRVPGVHKHVSLVPQWDFLELLAAADDPAVIALLTDADEMAIPVIVLGEYRYGIAQSRNRASYTNWLKGLLQDCLVLDIHEPTTQYYAEITLELRQKGRPIPTNDIWIAALISAVKP